MRQLRCVRILKATYSTASSPPNWSHTLHLPKSPFPAVPSAQKLVEYRRRCADDLYQWQRAQGSDSAEAESHKDDFILHDGPPYANGAVHVGHALNKILKDLILRTEISKGRRVKYQPGWDCHGLPIELKALQQSKSTKRSGKTLSNDVKKETEVAQKTNLSDADVRIAARSLALSAIDAQRKEFREWAVLGDWDRPYLTMDNEFEVSQLEIFRHMVKNGLIYRANMPVYWSPSSRSALAESELEYDEHHQCTAAFVKMPLVSSSKLFQGKVHPTHALIWTTTPWTLPANRAIAVGPRMLYGVYQVISHDGPASAEAYLISEKRCEHVQSYLQDGQRLQLVQGGISGDDLATSSLSYENVFDGTVSSILSAEFVTDSSGTGLVHMAPGHGSEDYQACRKHGLETTFAPVDDHGRFTSSVAPLLKDQALLTGLPVEPRGSEQVLNVLRTPIQYLHNARPQSNHGDLVFASHNLIHKNPIDWRTKKPVIVRSTAQWFADVSKINAKALQALEDVEFVPESGRNRLRAFVQGRAQWCISRQRAWGVPIPVLYNKLTDEENYSDEVIEHLIGIIKQRGTDAWFTDPADDPSYIPDSMDKALWVRKRDTMDVWFDSGTSWSLISPRNGARVADVYVEGSDQHRGWFQSSLLTKVAVASDEVAAPYKKLITHGFTLDGAGKKMSKSLGNVISPMEIIAGSLPGASKGKKGSLGPDLLRLWVAGCDYTKDVSVSSQGLLTVQQSLNKLRVTFRYLTGVLRDYHPQEVEPEQLLTQDRIILEQMSRRSRIIFDAYSKYKFFEGVKEMNIFINTELSAFYIEAVKDTLYAALKGDRERTQFVLHSIMVELLHWLTPVTPHLVEEVWESLPAQLRDGEHPLKKVWREPLSRVGVTDRSDNDTSLAFFANVNSAVKTAQERARKDGKLGSGLACHVELHFDDGTALRQSGFQVEELRNALVLSTLITTSDMQPAVSSAEANWLYEERFELTEQGSGSGRVVVLPPIKHKCARCWQYTTEQADGLCHRCEQAVEEQQGHVT